MKLALIIFICFMFYMIGSSHTVLIEVEEYYPGERDALIQLRDSFSSNCDLHSKWTGPPCYKNHSNWEGIVCSNGHVVHIALEGIQLLGYLPPTLLQNITFLTILSFRNNSIFGPLPNLTNLVHLQYVFLSRNRFLGPIPWEFTGLPKLTKLELQENHLIGQIPPFNQPTLMEFNVSDNLLEGPIPETPVLQRFSKSSYEHNSGLCGEPIGKPCPNVPTAPTGAPPLPPPLSPFNPSNDNKDKSLKVWNLALIVIAAALVPFIVMLVFLCYYYKRVHRKEVPSEAKYLGEGPVELYERKMQSSWGSREDPERRIELEFFDKERMVFDLDDLLRASAELMGKGKLGSSYKATLESGSVVAVKRLIKEMNGLSKKEFIQQMQLLGKLRHENLVEMVSFYYSKEEKLVIYEFVPHGNLFQHLHENRGVGRQALNWITRLSIVKDIAMGLTYLHQSLPSHKVPHANLKSTNILIYQNNQGYHCKLTDFGFLPLLPSRKSAEKLSVGRSPESFQGKKLTHKADVYCFGIVMLELITGKIPGEISPQNENTTDDLSDWVRTVVNTDWSTDILDMEIVACKEGHNEMLKLTEIALECTDTAPERRPKMSQVLRRIEEIEKENNKGKNIPEEELNEFCCIVTSTVPCSNSATSLTLTEPTRKEEDN